MNVLIRADASSTIGSGHVMRCLAIAQGLALAGHQVFFLTRDIGISLKKRIELENFKIFPLETTIIGNKEDAQATINLAKDLNIDWVILDGYGFDINFQKDVKSAYLKLLVIDDYCHAQHYYADIILNANIYAEELNYENREPYTQLLLGTRYVLLRQEFLKWQDWQRDLNRHAQNILVSLGGADPHNLSLEIIQALEELKQTDLRVIVVLGPNNSHYPTIEKYVKASAHFETIELQHNVSDMSALMQWADIAITGAGSTCWELVFMGLPSLTFVLAHNQIRISKSLDSLGIFPSMGWNLNNEKQRFIQTIESLLLSAPQRKTIYDQSKTLIDGKGVNRIVMTLHKSCLQLRLVTPKDCYQLWEWANDPIVRALSFTEEAIAWEDHVAWFESKLQDQDCIIYLATDEEKRSIGVIRYEKYLHKEFLISISLDKEFRGHGYGSTLIKIGSDKIFSGTDAMRIHAHIKSDNLPSVKAFQKAGFTSSEQYLPTGSHHLVCSRDAFFNFSNSI